MKKYFFVLIVLLLAVSSAYAGEATVTWDAPTTNADGTPISYFVGNYKVYYGPSSGNYTNSVTLVSTNSTVTYIVTNLPDNQLLYFAVTATNTLGNESGYSNEVSKSTALTYTVTASAGAGGTVTCTPTSVLHGGNSTCTITPNAGFIITDVRINNVSVSIRTTHTFSNVTANQAISATFAPAPKPNAPANFRAD